VLSLGGYHLSVNKIFDVRKLDSLGYRVESLRDPTISRFDTKHTCDTQTHSETDGIPIAYIRASIASCR